MGSGLAGLAADAVLAAHAAVVVFLVGGLAAVWFGARRGWRWVRHPGFRALQVAVMAFVAAQAVLGRLCPLTILEEALRRRAGRAGYDGGGFLAHWVGRWLYWACRPGCSWRSTSPSSACCC
jgi:hypothetical protein